MKLNYLDYCARKGMGIHQTDLSLAKGSRINFLANGGTINRTPGGYLLMEFAVDANLNSDEELSLMVRTTQPRRELEPICVGGLITAHVDWQGTIKVADQKNRGAVRTVPFVAGTIRAEKLNGQMKEPYPEWVAHHQATNSLVIKSMDHLGGILFVQSICLKNGHERMTRDEANVVLDGYLENSGERFFAVSYDGNHRAIH